MIGFTRPDGVEFVVMMPEQRRGGEGDMFKVAGRSRLSEELIT